MWAQLAYNDPSRVLALPEQVSWHEEGNPHNYSVIKVRAVLLQLRNYQLDLWSIHARSISALCHPHGLPDTNCLRFSVACHTTPTIGRAGWPGSARAIDLFGFLGSARIAPGMH